MNDTNAVTTLQNSTNGRFSLLASSLGAAIRLLDRVAPRRAEELATDLFLTPRRIPRPKREEAWLLDAASFGMVTSKGNRIEVRVWGEGEKGTVLLLHGWEGRASQMGAMALDLVEAGYRVVAPDFPAHGLSLGSRTNIVEASWVVSDVARRVGPLEAIVAHSFGCAAASVAIGRGVDVARAVFIAPAHDFTFYSETFSAALGLPKTMARRIQRVTERRIGVTWESLQPDALTRDRAVPLLVIHDEIDREIPLEQGAKVASVWPGATLMKTRGLGHTRILRDPSVARAARAFVDAASAESAAIAV
ncbi:MAG: alpha/beta fold hydrolase [Acidobacteria bacterium]|nr:alpha/beta fold hydrolase [Acidobacteriota bacterium]